MPKEIVPEERESRDLSAKNRPKAGDTVRITYREGSTGSGQVRVLQPLQDGMLVAPLFRDGLSFIPWTNILRWEKQ